MTKAYITGELETQHPIQSLDDVNAVKDRVLDKFGLTKDKNYENWLVLNWKNFEEE